MINFIEDEQLSTNEKDRIKILASQMARLGLDNDMTLKTLTQLEENKYKRNQSNNSIDMFTPTPTPTPSHSTFNRNNNKRYSINSSEQKDFFTTTAGQIEEKEEKEDEENVFRVSFLPLSFIPYIMNGLRNDTQFANER